MRGKSFGYSIRCVLSCAAALLVLAASVAASASIIDGDFEVATFGDTDLTTLDTNPGGSTISPGNGVGGSNALDNAGDASVGSAEITPLPLAEFSVFALFNGNDSRTNGGGFGVGWTQGIGYNAYAGASDPGIIVGLGRTGDSNFRLAYGAGGGGIGDLDNDFGSPGVDLVGGRWYRLSGQILFDPTQANEFTFNNVQLQDFGIDGLTPGAVVLSGTGATLSENGFTATSMARFFVSTNRDRGFEFIDNISVGIPEPTSLALIGFGAVAMLRRRRRG